MKKYIYLLVLLFCFTNSFSQKVYDRVNPDEFYIDLDTKTAKIQYDSNVISGNIEQIRVDYTNYYLLVNGGDTHLVLKQLSSSSVTQFEKFWLVKGNYKDALKITKKEQVPKKLELIAFEEAEMTRYGRYFEDYLYFYSESGYAQYLNQVKLEELIKESGFEGVYKVKINRSSGISLLQVEEYGELIISTKGMTLLTEVPGIIEVRGTWSAFSTKGTDDNLDDFEEDLNAGRLSVSGNLSSGFGDIFSISMTQRAGGITTAAGRTTVTSSFQIIEKKL